MMRSTISENSDPLRIQRLPPEVVNQIAAGEVVERPASVVKELLENSLDAGATRIEVHLKEGGLEEIRIIDNGRGIWAEDLPLAVERHATSKITRTSDLESLSTFGFRGEALSSIASVAELEICTRQKELEKGSLLKVTFGVEEEIRPTGCPLGTQICVRQLFKQVPARFKFLRSSSTELSHCVRTMKEVALGNPGIHFHLYHHQRVLAHWTSATRAERVQEILKPDWKALFLSDEFEDMRYEAFLTAQDFLQDRGELNVYINGRPIKNRILHSSIRNAYLEALGPHHEPSGVFYLEMRGDWVDVNVHPQKSEVRFYKQERIYHWILSSLRKQLTQVNRLNSNEILPENSPVELPKPTPVFNFTQSAPREYFKAAQPSPLSAFQSAGSTRIKFFGQLKSSLLLCEDSQGLWLVDPHALAEQRALIALIDQFNTKSFKMHALPIPKLLTLTPLQLSVFTKHLNVFNSVGFEIELFGDLEILVKNRLECLDPEQMVAVILKSLARFAVLEIPPVSELLSIVACHSVKSPDEHLSTFEVQTLLNEVDTLTESAMGPHGSPLSLHLSLNQIQKHFKHL